MNAEIRALVDTFLKDTETIDYLIDTFGLLTKKTNKVVNVFVDVLDQLNENDKFFESQATFTKKLFNAYVSIGFTREEAFNLTINTKQQIKDRVSSALQKGKK